MSKVYITKRNCLNGVDAIKRYAPKAEIVEEEEFLPLFTLTH